MNIFVTDSDPIIAAKNLCNAHIVKMVVESAQMLSTTHRILDGKQYVEISNGRRIKRWRHPNADFDTVLYKAVHVNHPCTLWSMKSAGNYNWHAVHYSAMAQEYERRYGKKHGAFNRDTDIGYILTTRDPVNIPRGPMTPFALAMKAYPECIVEGNAVESYRNYYRIAKRSFAKWTNSEPPEWFNE